MLTTGAAGGVDCRAARKALNARRVFRNKDIGVRKLACPARLSTRPHRVARQAWRLATAGPCRLIEFLGHSPALDNFKVSIRTDSLDFLALSPWPDDGDCSNLAPRTESEVQPLG